MMLKRIYIAVVLFAKQTDKQRKTGKPQCNICLPVNGGGCIKEEPLNFANIFLLLLSAKIEKVIFKALLQHRRIISERGKAKGCIFCCCHYQVCIFQGLLTYSVTHPYYHQIPGWLVFVVQRYGFICFGNLNWTLFFLLLTFSTILLLALFESYLDSIQTFFAQKKLIIWTFIMLKGKKLPA